MKRSTPRARRAPLVAAASVAAAAAALLLACHGNPAPPPSPPAPDALAVSTRELTTSEDGTGASFEVVLVSTPAATVEVEVRSGDPSEGLVFVSGYAAPAAGRELTFTPRDWDVPRRVVVQPVDDDVPDGDVDYTVAVRVTFAEDAVYLVAPQLAVRVRNADDDAPGIAVTPQAIETAENGPPKTFTVRLDTAPSFPVALLVASTDPSEGLVRASSCTWCSPEASLYLQFDAASWNVPQGVSVEPADDSSEDGPRTYAITLGTSSPAPEYAALAPRVVTVTNEDDDVAGLEVTAASTPLVTSEQGTAATFSVRLTTEPSADVVVPVTSGDPGEGLVATGALGPAARIELTFTPTSWSAPQTVTVVGQDEPSDPVVSDDVSYEIAVGPPASADLAWRDVLPRSVSVLNLDDDVPPVIAVSAAGTQLVTSEDGSSATFTISIDRQPATLVTIPVTSEDPSEGLVRGGSSPQVAHPSVEVTFHPLDWQAPRTITVEGQPDELLDGAQTYAITVGPASGDATYAALPPQAIMVRNSDDPSFSVTLATHDAALGAPRCSTVGFGCGTGTLVNGRAALGPEPGSPNTISGSCVDGTSGTYHFDESLDALKVYTLDGSWLAPGKVVRVDAKVWVWGAPYDHLDLYHAADATAPQWTFIGTFQATAAGPQTVSATYTLPSGTLQAIRGNWRYGGSAGSCTSGAYDDRDDLVFAVAP